MKNVKTDFGAVGDGATDDTAALQSAINGSVNGGQLLFPAGTYRVTSTLTLSGSGTTLIGEGPSATIIRHSGAVNTMPGAGTMILFPGILSQSNVSIEGIRFACFSGSCNYAFATTGAFPLREYTFRNCKFDGFYASAFRAAVPTERVLFDGCDMSAISMAAYSGSDPSTACINGVIRNSTIRNCYIHDTGQSSTLNHAIYLNGGCVNVQIINNVFQKIANDAVAFGTSTDGLGGNAQNAGLVFANNLVMEVSGAALRANSCTGVICTGNTVINTPYCATLGPNIYGWVVSNNVVTSNVPPATAFSGALPIICRAVYGASNGVICGNIGTYTYGYDVKYTVAGSAIMLDGCADLEIYGNTITGYNVGVNCVADNGNGNTCQRVKIRENNIALFDGAIKNIGASNPYGRTVAVAINGYSKDIQVTRNVMRNYPIGVFLSNKIVVAPANYMTNISVRENHMYNVVNSLFVDVTATVGKLKLEGNIIDVSGTVVWNGKIRDVDTESPPEQPAGVNRDSSGNYDPDKNFPR